MGSPASQRASRRLAVMLSKAPAITKDWTRLGLEASPPHQVSRTLVETMPFPLLHDELPRPLTHVLDDLETQQHASLAWDACHLAQVHAGVEEG